MSGPMGQTRPITDLELTRLDLSAFVFNYLSRLNSAPTPIRQRSSRCASLDRAKRWVQSFSDLKLDMSKVPGYCSSAKTIETDHSPPSQVATEVGLKLVRE